MYTMSALYNSSGPDPYDWFCDDDVKLFCEKLKRTVAAALRPYESDEVDIPSDCPLE